MVFTVIFFPSIVISDGDISLLLSESFQILVFFGINASIGPDGNIIMLIPDNATDHLIAHSDGSITSGNAESIHVLKDNANYQVSTTGNVKLVVQVTGGGSNTEFKIWKSTTVDSATGTTVYDFSNTVDLDNNEIFTTPVLEFAVTANDYINIEASGPVDISGVKAWIVEKPA